MNRVLPSPGRRSWHHQRGFSLVNTQFAVAILSIVLLGTLSAVTQSVKLDTLTRDRNRAIKGAQLEVENLLSKNRESFVGLFFNPANNSVNARVFNVTGLRPQEDDQGNLLPVGIMTASSPSSVPFNEAEYFTVYIEVRWQNEATNDVSLGFSVVVAPPDSF